METTPVVWMWQCKSSETSTQVIVDVFIYLQSMLKGMETDQCGETTGGIIKEAFPPRGHARHAL